MKLEHSTQQKPSERIPVTLLTGFLGAGKTTLLNRILNENHGLKIAVIENEFGEVGIDHDLVIGAEEELFEMNNGCICCTVRGDLLRILGTLLKRKTRLDRILIETTGMADPGPVAQTFFLDDELGQRLELDAIVTLVDAKHVESQIEAHVEARAQIAFADVIVLNKIDRVDSDQVRRVFGRLHTMNPGAKIMSARLAEVDITALLGLKAFALERALEIDAGFLEPEYPFEAGLTYALQAGSYVLQAERGHESSVRIASLFEEASDAGSAGRGRISQPGVSRIESDDVAQAVVLFSWPDEKRQWLRDGEAIPARPACLEWQLSANGGEFSRLGLVIDKPGYLRLFTQHAPEEFGLVLRQGGQTLHPMLRQYFKVKHDHDETIRSVGIEWEGELDPKATHLWISKLLQEKGADIYRSKGVLALRGEPNRFIFQGVHMLLDFAEERPWGRTPRVNRLVFIGKDLDREGLVSGFKSCLSRP